MLRDTSTLGSSSFALLPRSGRELVRTERPRSHWKGCVLPQPPSLAGMPVWFFRGIPCLIGWEDDPSEDAPGRWRLVARRFDDDSMSLVEVLSRSISPSDQVKMLGRLLTDEESVLDSAQASTWSQGGLVRMTGTTITLHDGCHHPITVRQACSYQVKGVRLPAW